MPIKTVLNKIVHVLPNKITYNMFGPVDKGGCRGGRRNRLHEGGKGRRLSVIVVLGIHLLMLLILLTIMLIF
jgi:hypothetical protein